MTYGAEKRKLTYCRASLQIQGCSGRQRMDAGCPGPGRLALIEEDLRSAVGGDKWMIDVCKKYKNKDFYLTIFSNLTL